MTQISDTPEKKWDINIDMSQDWPEAAQPGLLLTGRPGCVRGFIAAALLLPVGAVAAMALLAHEQAAGPEDGITTVTVQDCDVVGSFGPKQQLDSKYTVRIVKPGDQYVVVGLRTDELPEGVVRDPGSFEDSQVTLNDLLIGCIDIAQGEIDSDGTVGGVINLRRADPNG